MKPELTEALRHLRILAEFAYAQGYHELGYDPLATITEALGELDGPLCPGCSRPFATPDHDPLCSSCRESDTGERFPLKPAAAVAEPREIRCARCGDTGTITGLCGYEEDCRDCPPGPEPRHVSDPTANEMHVFHDGQDWYIATDAEDVRALRVAMYDGEPPEDAGVLEQLPDLEVIGVLCNENGRPDDHGTGIKKTAAEWVAQEGRGVLCSMDF